MEKGLWILNRNDGWQYKKWQNQNGVYLLWNNINGPFYLIEENVLNLLKILQQPKTIEKLYKEGSRYGIKQEEMAECLVNLERMGIIRYTNEQVQEDGSLRYVEPQMNRFHKNFLNLLKFLFIGISVGILLDLIYLFAFRYNLILSVARAPTLEDYFLVVTFSVLFTLLHEFFHALTTKLASGKFPPFSIKRMGIFIPIPVPKVNLNVTYLIDQRLIRIIILSSGLFIDLASLWFSFQMIIHTAQMPLWVYLTWFNLFSFVFNLLPLWSSDGYYILSELLNIPNLNFYAMESLKNLLRKGGSYSFGLVVYGGIKMGFEIIFFIFLLIIFYKFSCLAGKFGQYAFWIIFFTIFILNFIRGIRKSKARR